MPGVTFARVTQPHCERSQMWLTARHVQAEKTSFAKRVFCQEGVWQFARYSQTLNLLLSAVHKWNHWYFLHKQVYTPECCKEAECCLWINLHYQGHVPRNVVPPVTPVTYFHHSFILLSSCCFLVVFKPCPTALKMHAHSSYCISSLLPSFAELTSRPKTNDHDVIWYFCAFFRNTW